MRLGQGQHLTYCSNIHPGERWPEVLANLQTYLPRVRDQVCPGQPFGIGLRLSAQAAQTLAQPQPLALFQQFLRDNQFYVFTLNGFPYGNFHGAPVKQAVYLPDWRTPERLHYSNTLADVLAALLPVQAGLQGSVSSVPGAFKTEVRSSADVDTMRQLLVAHVAHLVALKARSGQHISLALEPEPCCFLETTSEAVAFFNQHLFGAAAVAQLASAAGLSPARARSALHEHVGLCLDLCHAAVEFEDPADCLAQLQAADVSIFKLQISAGLRLRQFDAASVQAVAAWAEPVYLHQVVAHTAAGLLRYTDLAPALDSLHGQPAPLEWRVHFHVPVFQRELGLLSSTRDFIEAVLARHKVQPLCQHLEVETYTWDVLPHPLRLGAVDQAIARELHWVLDQLTP